MAQGKISRRRFVKYVGAGVAAVAIAGIGYEGYQYLTPHPKEPLLVVTYGGSYLDALTPLATEFTSETGIPITTELHSGGGAAVIARIQADLPNMTRHLIDVSPNVWGAMDNQGWLAPLTPDTVPVISEYPDTVKYVGPTSKQVVGLATDTTPVGWAYRSDLFPKDLQPLDNYDKLLDPRLKGKLQIGDMVYATGASAWLFALAKGGDEKNIDPGWAFLKQLAEAGQIGAVSTSDATVINGLTTGDSWASIFVSSFAVTMAKQNIAVNMDKSENTKWELFLEGFCVTNSSRTADAYKFMNFLYQAENNQKYATALGSPPTHPKAVVTDPLIWQYNLKPDELGKYGYVPDFDYLSQHTDERQKRFEAEILPLIKAS
jgi:spermidine/putrescine-binding protein